MLMFILFIVMRTGSDNYVIKAQFGERSEYKRVEVNKWEDLSELENIREDESV